MAEKPKVPPIKKIRVDHNLCIGSASCVAIAAKTFVLDTEGKAVVLDPKGKEAAASERQRPAGGWADSDEAVLEAAKSCPTSAIILEDEEGKQVYP